MPVAALTALQGLRDHGKLQPGQKVLINGASGGVGTFAVQIAKALGAEVTAVCSTRNVELARSLGADHVVDYTREDFTRSGERYDVLFDNAGSRSWSECKRVLDAEGDGRPRRRADGRSRARAPRPRARDEARVAARQPEGRLLRREVQRADMDVLRELLEAGTVKPVVDRRYPLSEIADAFRYLGEGHAQGKVVVTV